MNITQIAKVAHEINAAYCKALGDTSQKSWGQTPEDIKQSAEAGVVFHLNNPASTPESSHANWCTFKIADGWEYGEEKDTVLKTHPCLVAYDDLPEEQKAKDYIFKQVVESLRLYHKEV